MRSVRGRRSCFIAIQTGSSGSSASRRSAGARTVGRNAESDLSLAWDDQVSALHAVIEPLAEKLDAAGRRPVAQRLLCQRRARARSAPAARRGPAAYRRTTVLVRNPADTQRSATTAGSVPAVAPHLSEQQRKVLSILCRPLESQSALSPLPTNQEIADELHLSVAAVKLHLRALFDKFGVAHLAQNRKRLALAQQALQLGLLGDRPRE